MKSEIQNSVRYLLAIAGLGGLLYGIDFGVIAAASPYIKALRLFSDAELSWIVGAVLFGGIVSSLTAGMLAERFGRKRMIVASAALFLVAIPTVCLSEKSLLPMLFGRVMQGVSAGYMAVVMPMYLAETLPPEIRGRGTGVFQFCLETKGKNLDELEHLFDKRREARDEGASCPMSNVSRRQP